MNFRKAYIAILLATIPLGIFCGMLSGAGQPAQAQYTWQYWPIVFNAQGLNLNVQPMNCGPDQFTKLDNFYTTFDWSSTERLGALTKIPATADWSFEPMSANVAPRGLYQFFYTQKSADHSVVIVPVSDLEYETGSIEVTSASQWFTLKKTTATSEIETFLPYQFSFAQNYDAFRGTNTVYFSNGDKFYKWFYAGGGPYEDIVCEVQDTGLATCSVSGTATFTNGTTEVSGSGTSFLTNLYKGMWIAEKTDATLYEIDKVLSDTSLFLRNDFDGTTISTTTAVSTSSEVSFKPRHLVYWKSRLWAYNLIYPDSDDKLATIRCSAVVSSVTPQALDDWSGSDTGFVDVPGGGVYGSALIATDDYLFAFKNSSYSVYRYNANLLPPIQLVNSFEWGCTCPRTIKRVGNNLIYYTGFEVRRTNGFADTSLSDPITRELIRSGEALNFIYYYQLASYDNWFPYAAYDKIRNYYHIYFPGNTTTKQFTYDINRGIWSGQSVSDYIGPIIEYIKSASRTGSYFLHLPSYWTTAEKVKKTEYSSVTASSTATGEIQSPDLVFNEPKKEKRINWVEFWVHVPASATVTFEFNYYLDHGNLALSTSKIKTVEASADPNNLEKIRFPVNAQGTYFRWRLRDIASSAVVDGQTSIVGGNIQYSVIDVN